MRFKLDENLPVELADLFRAAGHDAITALDQNLKGVQDSDLASVCRREGRTIVTLDIKAFALAPSETSAFRTGDDRWRRGGQFLSGKTRIAAGDKQSRRGQHSPSLNRLAFQKISYTMFDVRP